MYMRIKYDFFILPEFHISQNPFVHRHESTTACQRSSYKIDSNDVSMTFPCLHYVSMFAINQIFSRKVKRKTIYQGPIHPPLSSIFMPLWRVNLQL